MKKKMILLFICILTFASTANAVLADTSMKKIKAFLNGDIHFSLNDKEWIPKSQTGEKLSPLIYEGATYLPVRAVAEATGLELTWNDATKLIEFKRKLAVVDPSLPLNDSKMNTPDILADFEFTNKLSNYNSSILLNQNAIGESINLGGVIYQHGLGIALNSSNLPKAESVSASMVFQLKGEYRKLTAITGIGHFFGQPIDTGYAPGVLSIIGDGKVLKTYTVSGVTIQDIDVDISGVEELTIECKMNGAYTTVLLANAYVSKF